MRAISKIKLLLAMLCLLFLVTSCTTWKLGTGGQKKISGKTYVIVGASSGFGRGVAQELGKYKANVVLTARRTDLLEEIADIIRGSGGKAIVTMCRYCSIINSKRYKINKTPQFLKSFVYKEFFQTTACLVLLK